MPPKRQAAHLDAVHAAPHAPPPPPEPIHIHDIPRFTFSILVTGCGFRAIHQVFLWNNIVTPCSTSFYKAQKNIFGPLHELSRESVDIAREGMAENTHISFDGSWSHKRNAAECIVVAIDISRNLIIDYEVVRKSKNGITGNYVGSSNGMEVAALKGIIERLQSDTRIVGYVHDSDSKATAAIRRAGWNIEEFFDPNHISKCYDRRWAKATNSALHGLGLKLKKWFNFLIHADYSDERKVELWRNAVEHFKGNHRFCPPGHEDLASHPRIDDPQAIYQLEKFIKDTVNLVLRTRNGFDSQMCESFNAVKSHFANKTYSWKISWEFRMAASVLQVKDPLHWRTNLALKCNIALPGDEAMTRLDAIAAKGVADNNRRRDDKVQEKERKRRIKKAEDQAKITAGRRDYVGRPRSIQTEKKAKKKKINKLPIALRPPGPTPEDLEELQRMRDDLARRRPPTDDTDIEICRSPTEPVTPPTRMIPPTLLNDGPWSEGPFTVEEVLDEEDLSWDPEAPVPRNIEPLPEDLSRVTWFSRREPRLTQPAPFHGWFKQPVTEYTAESEHPPLENFMVIRERKQGLMYVDHRRTSKTK
jgi:hypothetical protein